MGGNQGSFLLFFFRSICIVAIKRLKKEYDEIEKNGAELPFTVHPVEVLLSFVKSITLWQDNFLEWHFTLQGPSESVFEHGLYHGRLIFPADYPFSAPNLMFITPSGRFQVNTKICLTVTGFHPEHWQPAWGVRTMLIAIRDHFTVEDQGAIGYLGYSKEDRARLAVASRNSGCKGCGYNPPPLPSVSNEALNQELVNASVRRPTESLNAMHLIQFVAIILIAVGALIWNCLVKP